MDDSGIRTEAAGRPPGSKHKPKEADGLVFQTGPSDRQELSRPLRNFGW
jgi:hypothetical protein